MLNGSRGGGVSNGSVQADLESGKRVRQRRASSRDVPPVWRRRRHAHAFSAVDRDDKHYGGGLLARVAGGRVRGGCAGGEVWRWCGSGSGGAAAGSGDAAVVWKWRRRLLLLYFQGTHL
jgi:hypothetical protein